MTTTAPLHVVERRIFATEFREVPGSNGRQRWATAVTYDTVDQYGTTWLPGCFSAGLEERMPTILYGHDWYNLDHVLGSGIDYKDTAGGCDVLIEFADPELVPSARLAMVLTAPPNPVLRDMSVGFDRKEWIRKDDLTPEQLAMGAEEAMVEAVMDELSLCVRGAVPGAQLRGKRSWVINGQVSTEPPAEASEHVEVSMGASKVDLDSVIAVIRKKESGGMTEQEARTAIELLATEDEPITPPVPDAPAATDDALLVLDELLRGDAPDEQRWRRTVSRLEARFADLFVNDLRGMLNDALNDRFQPGPDRWLWIADFTDGEVVFELEGFDDSGTFMLAYTRDGDAITLDAGDPVEVQRHTTYVPDPDETDRGAAEGEQRAALPSDADIDAALALARVKR